MMSFSSQYIYFYLIKKTYRIFKNSIHSQLDQLPTIQTKSVSDYPVFNFSFISIITVRFSKWEFYFLHFHLELISMVLWGALTAIVIILNDYYVQQNVWERETSQETFLIEIVSNFLILRLIKNQKKNSIHQYCMKLEADTHKRSV